MTVPCVVYRGGTSRGLFFHERDLPKDEQVRRQIFLKGIGAEDASHVNGLGGGTSHTSKVVIIDKSFKPGVDVNYTFVQLGMGSDVIDYEGTCGNLMAAVGAFAVDEGMIEIDSEKDIVDVNVWSTNINKKIVIQVPVKNGKAQVSGNYFMPGVNELGAKYLVNIASPGGGKTGVTLPLLAKRKMNKENGIIHYSFSDIVNPFVYVKAEDLSFHKEALCTDFNQNEDLVNELEEIRKHVSVQSGLALNLKEAENILIALPKVSFISEPKDYLTLSGKRIKKDEYDIFARMVSVKKMHKTFAVSGLLNLAGTCLLDGTIPNELYSIDYKEGEQIIRIGHPGGITEVRVKKNENDEKIDYVGLDRTARKIMAGDLYIPLA